MHRDIPARADLREDRPRLDRIRDQPRLIVGVRDNDVRLREHVIHSVRRELPDIALVRPEWFVHEWRAVLERRRHTDGRGKWLVGDVDQFRRVLREGARLGYDDGDAVSLIARLVDRKREMLRRSHLLGHRPRARQRALPIVAKVGAGEDGNDAVGRPGGLGVDRGDSRPRIGAADNGHHELPGDRQIVDIGALAKEQSPILLALHRRADERCPDLGRAHDPLPAAETTASTMF